MSSLPTAIHLILVLSFGKKSKTIGKDIENNHIQLERGGGYDHCWVLNEQNIGLRTAAILFDPASGRQMEVLAGIKLIA